MTPETHWSSSTPEVHPWGQALWPSAPLWPAGVAGSSDDGTVAHPQPGPLLCLPTPCVFIEHL